MVVENQFYQSDNFTVSPDGILIYDEAYLCKHDTAFLIPNSQPASEFVWGAVSWFVDD